MQEIKMKSKLNRKVCVNGIPQLESIPPDVFDLLVSSYLPIVCQMIGNKKKCEKNKSINVSIKKL